MQYNVLRGVASMFRKKCSRNALMDAPKVEIKLDKGHFSVLFQGKKRDAIFSLYIYIMIFAPAPKHPESATVKHSKSFYVKVRMTILRFSS